MNEKEMELAVRVEKILGYDVKYTRLVDVIEKLVEVIENGRTN